MIENTEIYTNNLRDDWALSLMEQGVIVKLSISRWRAFSKITPELLGLKFYDEEGFNFTKKYLDLGRQKLLPAEIMSEIDAVEVKARNNLDNYSFDTVWGRFVPFTAFNEWEYNNNIIRNDFFKQGIVLRDRYDGVINSVKKEYRKMAKDVWLRMYSNGNGEATESFIENFVGKVVEKIPCKEEIYSSFKYSSTFLIIPMPSFMSDNSSKIEQIKYKEFDTELEKQTKARIRDECLNRKRDLIDGFLESTVVSMRKYIYETCTAILMSMSKNEKNKINVNHISRLKDMIKKIKLLNFYNDYEISNLINDLGIELERNKSGIDVEFVINKLKEIINISQKEYDCLNLAMINEP